MCSHSNKTRGYPNIGGGYPNIGAPIYCKTRENKGKQALFLRATTRCKHKIRTKVRFLPKKRPVLETSTFLALTQPRYPPTGGGLMHLDYGPWVQNPACGLGLYGAKWRQDAEKKLRPNVQNANHTVY
jgi:hypothetical protein